MKRAREGRRGRERDGGREVHARWAGPPEEMHLHERHRSAAQLQSPQASATKLPLKEQLIVGQNVAAERAQSGQPSRAHARPIASHRVNSTGA